MVVASSGQEIIGAAAVELYAGGALLRSVVVSPRMQGQGLGHRLTEAALELAKTGIAVPILRADGRDLAAWVLPLDSGLRNELAAPFTAIRRRFRASCSCAATASRLPNAAS